MAVKRDYYEVLGVARQCTAEELRQAFRRIAMDSHPDRHPNDPVAHERFKEASEAYAVLSDPERRRSYDLFGHSAVSGGPGIDFSDMPFADIFDTFFGGGFGARSRRERTNRGDDLRYDLTITFEEAFTGVEKQLDVPRLARCDRCSGSGAEPGTGVDNCPGCGGSGHVRRTAQSFFGQVVTTATCPTCGGAGRLLKNPCVECRGRGRVEKARRLAVKIPAGVDTGSQIRISGEGEAGVRGGAAGDLYVVLRVKPHPQLARHEQDIVFELRVNMVQAALGDRVEIPTLEGPVEISIPAGTQNGQSFRLKGRGMPDVRGGRRGDQYVVVQVVIPKDLSPEQKALLRKVGGLTGKPEKVSKGFFDKLRDAISLDELSFVKGCLDFASRRVRCEAVTGRAVAASAAFLLFVVACAPPHNVAVIASPTPSPSPTPTTPLGAAAATFHMGEVGVAYTRVALSVSGGVAPYTWTVTSGALPGGLTLGGDGSISGNPTAGGTFSFTIQVADSGDSTASIEGKITIAGALTGNLVPACQHYCNVELGCMDACGSFGSLSGGVGPYTYSVTQGPLPAGTSLNGLSLSGTFRGASGWLQFSVQVSDSLGATSTISPRFWMYPHISLAGNANCFGNYLTGCTAHLAISGGVPGSGASVRLVSEAPYAPGQGCWDQKNATPLPANYGLSAGGGYVTLTIPNHIINGYGGIWTVQVTSQDLCGPNTYCTTNQGTFTIGVQCG